MHIHSFKTLNENSEVKLIRNSVKKSSSHTEEGVSWNICLPYLEFINEEYSNNVQPRKLLFNAGTWENTRIFFFFLSYQLFVLLFGTLWKLLKFDCRVRYSDKVL